MTMDTRWVEVEFSVFFFFKEKDGASWTISSDLFLCWRPRPLSGGLSFSLFSLARQCPECTLSLLFTLIESFGSCSTFTEHTWGTEAEELISLSTTSSLTCICTFLRWCWWWDRRERERESNEEEGSDLPPEPTRDDDEGQEESHRDHPEGGGTTSRWLLDGGCNANKKRDWTFDVLAKAERGSLRGWHEKQTYVVADVVVVGAGDDKVDTCQATKDIEVRFDGMQKDRDNNSTHRHTWT